MKLFAALCLLHPRVAVTWPQAEADVMNCATCPGQGVSNRRCHGRRAWQQHFRRISRVGMVHAFRHRRRLALTVICLRYSQVSRNRPTRKLARRRSNLSKDWPGVCTSILGGLRTSGRVRQHRSRTTSRSMVASQIQASLQPLA